MIELKEMNHVDLKAYVQDDIIYCSEAYEKNESKASRRNAEVV